MSNTIDIDKMADVIMKGLQEYADATSEDVKKAVRKVGRSVRQDIMSGIQEQGLNRTGQYKRSWTVKTTGETAHSLQLTVHSRNRYQIAHLLEKGHAKRGGGRAKAYPHIAPAEERGQKLLEQEITKTLGG